MQGLIGDLRAAADAARSAIKGGSESIMEQHLLRCPMLGGCINVLLHTYTAYHLCRSMGWVMRHA